LYACSKRAPPPPARRSPPGRADHDPRVRATALTSLSPARVGRTPGRPRALMAPTWRWRPGAARPAERRQGLVRPFRVGTTLKARATHQHARANKHEKSPHPTRGGQTARLDHDEERYATKGGCARERERERERDASATLTRPIKDPSPAQRLSTALFPKETTRTPTPILVVTRFLSRFPSKTFWLPAMGPTQTQSYVGPIPLQNQSMDLYTAA
jgi:hypothetical protein